MHLSNNRKDILSFSKFEIQGDSFQLYEFIPTDIMCKNMLSSPNKPSFVYVTPNNKWLYSILSDYTPIDDNWGTSYLECWD